MLTPTVNDNPSLERIEMLLLELGVQPNLDGFVYLARTIQYYCTGKFKQISPIAEIVAAEYNTTSFSIKRMMPYVIQNADNMLKRIVQKTGVPISKTNLTLLSFVTNISSNICPTAAPTSLKNASPRKPQPQPTRPLSAEPPPLRR